MHKWRATRILVHENIWLTTKNFQNRRSPFTGNERQTKRAKASSERWVRLGQLQRDHYVRELEGREAIEGRNGKGLGKGGSSCT